MLFKVAQFGPTDALERDFYDRGVRGTERDLQTTRDLAIIAIDDPSIERLGRWPWSRTVIADLVARLEGAKVIGLPVFYSEPQLDPGLKYVERLEDLYRNAKLDLREDEFSALFEETLAMAYQELDADAALVDVIANAENVVLPMLFRLPETPPIGRPEGELPDFALPSLITAVQSSAEAGPGRLADMVLWPLDYYAASAVGLGHLSLDQDIDGGVRRDLLAVNYYDSYFPSLSLMIAARSLNLSMDDVQIALGESVSLGRLTILTDADLSMRSGFYLDRSSGLATSAFKTYSFADVYDGSVPIELFNNKIVLIGPTAAGLGTTTVTPISSGEYPVNLMAHFITSILNEDFYVRPAWVGSAEWGLLAVITLYLMLLMPRLPAGFAAATSLLLLVALLATSYIMLSGQSIWLQTATAASLLLVGHLLLTTKKFLVTEKGKEKVESAAVEDNKMLGLSFQAQGQLDMALDKFRKLPIDQSVADLLYNLALDFERKRQFGKAGSIYDMLLAYDKKFKDVKDRKERAGNLESTLVMGGGGAAAGGTLIMDPNNMPTLGRYQIDRELGKGAMGIVYEGHDPKINRVVAIKTMALAQEFEGPELDEAKERFFREAETAGRLNHPNIVTIYDAGEDQELAYIAMEFMKGSDLSDYTKKDSLMPAYSVMVVISKVAEALDYAHANGIVHRDIKPANVMLLSDNTVKVMDFGIARITESSKTKTGVVMGTPSYMSPEQLAGQHVDGRSDLFSLAVMMYEMLTGVRPFTGDSMATLMFNISQGEHRSIQEVKPDMPTEVVEIINHGLQKKPEDRFQTGKEFSSAVIKAARAMRAGG
ncbi:MAG TPA: serine/threonine protein kinase [Gammaproteobacteria bacterium]|nr:serine/threonine protein kinase [Gammaproteobacteria bacterium]